MITEPDQVRIPDDYLKRPTMAAVTGAIRLLRQRYPDVAIVGKVYGPWSVAYQMVGISDFLIDVILDQDKIRRYLDAFLPACIMSARAQFEAGADAVMWADHTTGDLCRPETYRDFLLEMHQQITQEMGGPGIFHCCGKTIDRVHLFAAAGWDVFHFESQVDAREARELAGSRMALFGNLNNPTLLYQGDTERVYQACWDLLDAGVDALAPEGSVPLLTKKEPLMAINRAAVDWSNLHRGESGTVVRPDPGPSPAASAATSAAEAAAAAAAVGAADA
jgi:[methyl-Co(III) methanol-specific corrinoid protein]:coenzyme M methyltransferase